VQQEWQAGKVFESRCKLSKTTDQINRSNDHAPRERRPAESALQEATLRLLEELPEGAKLTALALKFPRIANHIAQNWSRPERLKPYFAGLLIDERGGRQGFPPEVATELLRLSWYYETRIYPKAKEERDRDIWGHDAP
jgi:hypothetical protein